MRLDGHRVRQSIVGLSAHCANSYIPQYVPVLQLTLVPSVFGESLFENGFLYDPVSILHHFTIFKWFLYT